MELKWFRVIHSIVVSALMFIASLCDSRPHCVSLELDLEGLVELAGEGVCGRRSGALLRAGLQCGPLGLEGIGWMLNCIRLSRPVVRPVKSHIAFGRLQCSGVGHRR